MIILNTYKITELYNIFANDEESTKYINDLFAVANEYSNRAYALMELYAEAHKESKEERKINILEIMNQAYDILAVEDQKKFCEEMLERKNFFQNAHKKIMSIYENAVEMQKDNEMIE